METKGQWEAFSAEASKKHTEGHLIHTIVRIDPELASPAKFRKALVTPCPITHAAPLSQYNFHQLYRLADGTLCYTLLTKKVPRPQMVHMCNSTSNTIDKRNGDAMDTMHTEKFVRTHYWIVRLNLWTLQKMAAMPGAYTSWSNRRWTYKHSQSNFSVK